MIKTFEELYESRKKIVLIPTSGHPTNKNDGYRTSKKNLYTS